MTKKIGLYGTAVYFLLIWTVFQEFVLGILYHYIHVALVIKILFFTKDVLFIALYIVGLLKTKLPKRFVTLQICYLPFIVYGTLLSFISQRVSVTTILSSTRGLLLLPAFVTIGYSIRKNEQFLKLIKTRFMKFLVAVAAFGILDYILDMIIGTKTLWTDFVQLGTYMTDIKGQGGVLRGDLPGNFYTYSELGMFSQKRLVSFWAGPLTSGYCLLIPFMYYFFQVIKSSHTYQHASNSRNVKICFVIVTIALFLTFTRGIILPSIFVVILCVLYQYKKKKDKFLLMLIVVLTLGLVGLSVYWDKIFGYIYNGSTLAHISSLESSLKAVSFLGQGAGTFAAATTEGTWTESTYISVAGQLGILAMVIYILLFIEPIRVIFRKRKEVDNFVFAMAIAGLIYFVTGIISEQLAAYTSIAPYYVIIGASYRNSKNKHILAGVNI